MPSSPTAKRSRIARTTARSAPGAKLENVDALVSGIGSITIGGIGTIRCVATTCDQGGQLAMLVRKPGEPLVDLLRRLDTAIASAWDDEIFIDEINGDPEPVPRRR